MRGKFRGVFTPLITPFKENGEIDFDGLEHLLGNLIFKVDGFFVNATTGEFTSLTLKEKKKIMIFVRETCKDKVKLFANVSSTSFKEVLELIDLSRKLEYDAVVSPPPYYLIPDRKGLIEYFTSIAKISEMETIIYNIPSCTGYSIDVGVVKEIALKEEKVSGIKATLDSLSYIKDLVLSIKKEREDFSVLTGLGFYLSSTLLFGGDGGILALSHIAPNVLKSIVDDTEKGNLEALKAHNNFIMNLSEIYKFGTSFASSIKVSLKLMGFPITTYVRKPLRQDGKETFERIEGVLKKLKIL